MIMSIEKYLISFIIITILTSCNKEVMDFEDFPADAFGPLIIENPRPYKFEYYRDSTDQSLNESYITTTDSNSQIKYITYNNQILRTLTYFQDSIILNDQESLVKATLENNKIINLSKFNDQFEYNSQNQLIRRSNHYTLTTYTYKNNEVDSLLHIHVQNSMEADYVIEFEYYNDTIVTKNIQYFPFTGYNSYSLFLRSFDFGLLNIFGKQGQKLLKSITQTNLWNNYKTKFEYTWIIENNRIVECVTRFRNRISERCKYYYN